MKLRILSILLIGMCAAAFLLAFAWPAVAITLDTVLAGKAPDDGWAFSHRQWVLLGKSLQLAGLATLLCLVVSLPAAYVLGQAGRPVRRPVLTTLLMASLLCSPMVYAFGWQRILPTQLGESARLVNVARCIGVWALWAWPIPALLIGAGYSRIGHQAHEAAKLETSSSVAFMFVVLPLLLRYVTLSAGVLFVLFLGEYSVPHACGLIVYATELLGWATCSSRTIDTVWPALLPTAVVLAGLCTLYVLWRCWIADEETPTTTGPDRHSSKAVGGVVLACLAVSFVLPICVLIGNVRPASVIGEALDTYWWEMLCSLGIAALSGLVVVGMGLGLFAVRRLGTVALLWTLVFGALPGALVGKALVVAYLPGVFSLIYDSWLIVAFCYVSRFGWVGLLIAWLITRSTSPEIIAHARIDGASRVGLMGFIQMPMHWPALVCGAGVVAALSLAEVAGSSLVRVPQVNLVAHIIIEKFHRLEDGMLISLSLCLVVVSLAVALLLVLLLGRERREAA